MSTEFTPEEIKYAEKYVCFLKKRSQQCRRTRWISFAGSVFMILMAIVWFYLFIHHLENGTFDLLKGLRNLDPYVMESYVNHQTRFMLLLGLTFLMGLYSITWGVVLLLFTLLKWNRHLLDGILGKVLRKIVENEGRSSR